MKIKKLALVLVFFSICYLLIPRYITILLYPWQCKGIIKDINPNLFHIPAYIIAGYFLGLWAILLGIAGELMQFARTGNFGWQDLFFNYTGILIGILLCNINTKYKAVKILLIIIVILSVGAVILFFGGNLQTGLQWGR